MHGDESGWRWGNGMEGMWVRGELYKCGVADLRWAKIYKDLRGESWIRWNCRLSDLHAIG